MNDLQKAIAYYAEAEYPTAVGPAPKDAHSFDEILVVWSDETKKFIWRVGFFMQGKTTRWFAR
jgi:hypothetical protein